MRTAPYPEVDPAFGNWLAGFIDGEGSFSISGHDGRRYKCRFALAVRDDDRSIIEEVRGRAGFGSVWSRRAGYRPDIDAKPQAIWAIVSKADCLRLVALLDVYPLRAKKARDFKLWREAVLLWAKMQPRGAVSNYDWSAIARIRDQLMAARAYDSPPIRELPELPPRLWED